MVSDAISAGNVQAINYFVAQRYIETLGRFADSPNQKMFFMPVDAAGIMGAIGGIAELVREGASGGGSGGGSGSGGGGSGPWRRGSGDEG